MVKIIEIINEEFIAPNECLAVIFADSKEELSSEYSVSGLPTGRTLAPGCKFKTADGSEGYLKSDNTIEWVVEPSDLPPVDSSDNGKVLVVEDGQWAVGESPVTPEDIQEAVDNYCEENFSEWAGGLDSGLTQPLMAAPADKVGELNSALSELEDAVFTIDDGSDFTWESGTYYSGTGEARSTTNAIRVQDINYYTKGSVVKLNATADNTFSLRVLVMQDAENYGATYVKEEFTGVSSVTTTKDGYLRIALLKNNIGTDYTQKSKVDFTLIEADKISALKDRVDNLENKTDFTLDDVAGYKKPNLISEKYTNATLHGVSIVQNSDGSVTMTGTADGTNGGFTAHATLPIGKYILSGVIGGASNTYIMRLKYEDNTYFDMFDGEKEFEIESAQTVRIELRFASNASNINTTYYPMIRDASIYDGTYAKYGDYAVYKSIQSLINYTKFNWSGKKMNALGDSIVKGGSGNFIKVIGGILNLSTVRNYGISGSCISSTDIDAEKPPAVTRYVDMDDDADIILVHAGTNDYTKQVPIGAENSTDTTTFNGALNVLMTGLKAKYPKALIIFSNILDRIQDNNTGTYPIVCQTYRDTLEAACHRNRIVFYNGYYELNFDFHKDYYDHVLSNDGLHPNQDGANIMGRSIAGFIKWH